MTQNFFKDFQVEWRGVLLAPPIGGLLVNVYLKTSLVRCRLGVVCRLSWNCRRMSIGRCHVGRLPRPAIHSSSSPNQTDHRVRRYRRRRQHSTHRTRKQSMSFVDSQKLLIFISLLDILAILFVCCPRANGLQLLKCRKTTVHSQLTHHCLVCFTETLWWLRRKLFYKYTRISRISD